MNQLEDKFINKDNYKIFRFFSILCILRIIPYAQDKNDFIWLKQTLDKEYHVINMLKTCTKRKNERKN